MSVQTKTIVSCENEIIRTIEKGNFDKVGNGITAEDVYVAFSVKGENDIKTTKAILKGIEAYEIYDLFLANGNTMAKEIGNKLLIKKDVRVSFTGFLKEERKTEIIVTNCADFKFTFNYTISEK